jgi:hypothetical protein
MAWPLGHEPEMPINGRRASYGALYGFLRAICRPFARDGTSKSVASHRFVVLSAEHMADWDGLGPVHPGLAHGPDRT